MMSADSGSRQNGGSMPAAVRRRAEVEEAAALDTAEAEDPFAWLEASASEEDAADFAAHFRDS